MDGEVIIGVHWGWVIVYGALAMLITFLGATQLHEWAWPIFAGVFGGLLATVCIWAISRLAIIMHDIYLADGVRLSYAVLVILLAVIVAAFIGREF